MEIKSLQKKAMSSTRHASSITPADFSMVCSVRVRWMIRYQQPCSVQHIKCHVVCAIPAMNPVMALWCFLNHLVLSMFWRCCWLVDMVHSVFNKHTNCPTVGGCVTCAVIRSRDCSHSKFHTHNYSCAAGKCSSYVMHRLRVP